jgi:hypothetical protein
MMASHQNINVFSFPFLQAFLTALVWIVGVPFITSPAHDVAVEAGEYNIPISAYDNMIIYGIRDANLYFSSWGGLIVAIYIVLNLGREYYDIPPGKGYHTSHWLWLCTSSVVALGSSSRLYSDIIECNSDNEGICKDLRIGMGLSAASTAMSLFLIACAQFRRAPLHEIGMCSGIGVITMWAVCLAYLTFGNAPASTVGNLFFSIWISLILSIVLTANHTKEVFSSKNEGDGGAEHRGGPDPTEGVDPTDNQTGPAGDTTA